MLLPHRAGEAVVEDVQPVRRAHSEPSSAEIVSSLVIRITKERDFTHGLQSHLRARFIVMGVWGSVQRKISMSTPTTCIRSCGQSRKISSFRTEVLIPLWLSSAEQEG